MKKIVFMLTVLTVSLFAEVKSEYISKELLKQNISIVDIRTPREWRETGLLKGAIPIMFFNANGNYNAKKFLNKLHEKVNTTKSFAIICHTGKRTAVVAPWLAKKFGYKVINLKGGMHYARKILHLKTVPYK